MDAHGLALGIKLRDEFEILPKVETMDRTAYVLDNGKIGYGMLQARNGKICPGFDQVYETIEKSPPKSRYLGYDANLQRFSTDITRYLCTNGLEYLNISTGINVLIFQSNNTIHEKMINKAL